ncbi:replication factor C subunit 1 [Chironomus tepperi]|uniref:replication factor C subunit 1 n=1 Tax=Chironomus tepperi TaxID=113505 RepID=UPI00391F62D5
MSRDIRSFFKIDSSNKRKNENEHTSSVSKHNKIDDEKSEQKNIKKKRRIVDSDDETEEVHQKKSTSKKIKESKPEKSPNEVKNIKDLFGGPIVRKERPKEVKTSPKEDLNASVISGTDDELAIVDKIENKLHETKPVISPGKENHKTNGTKEKSPAPIVNSIKTEEKKDPGVKDRKSGSSSKEPKVEPDQKTESSNKDQKSKDITVKDTKHDHSSKHSPKKERRSKDAEAIKPKVELNKSSSSSQPTTSNKSTEGTVKSTKSETITKSPSKTVPQPISAPPSYSFVDKYKPTNVKQIIGQQGPQSNANKLQNWLLQWHKNHGDPANKNKKKANPFARDNDGSSFRAALLSGPPGIGKTTTAHLVCKELLFDAVEFNASDTRSKRLLKEEVTQLLSNKSLKGYLTGDDKTVSKRHVLIMDEVDGMAGNEDRGGVAELIALIKESHIPIICMCNDRSHPKMRSLVNYCFDLRFNKPSVNQIRSAMMSVCFKEGIKLDAGAMDAIINGTGNDVRQTLNHLAMYSASKDTRVNSDKAKKNAQMSEKDIKIGPWDVIRKVFSAEEHKTMSLNDKSDLFFYDYSIAPLFVQENYLHVKPSCKDSEILERIAKTADSISLGDNVDKRIRSNMAWSLLPTQAMFASVIPGEFMAGSFKSPPNFPAWLGKNSKAQKRKRMAQELHDHTRTATSGSRSSVRLDYAQFIVQAIIRPLKEKGTEGVKDALEVLKEYRLLREDIESLLELTTWGSSKNPWDQVDSKTKAALTRAYNKEVQAYTYSAQAGVKKKKSAAGSDEMYGEEDDENVQESEDEEDDSLEKNSMIKVKKVTTKQEKEPKAGTSKSTAAKSKPAAKPRAKK